MRRFHGEVQSVFKGEVGLVNWTVGGGGDLPKIPPPPPPPFLLHGLSPPHFGELLEF